MPSKVEGQLGRVAVPAVSPKPRKQWQGVIDEPSADLQQRQRSPEPQRRIPGGAPELSPEQRREAWEEQRAAAERNRRNAAGDGQQVRNLIRMFVGRLCDPAIAENICSLVRFSLASTSVPPY